MLREIRAQATARIRRAWGERSFDRVAKGVLRTVPLSVSGESPLFLSMVCHRDVAAYLLAIKSLYLAIGQGRIVVIDDGSLNAEDCRILRHHIPRLDFLRVTDIDTRTCPRGACWERLVKIIQLTADNYVIQADADTLVSGAIPEVVDCWKSNRSFLLGTDVGQEVAPAASVAREVLGWIEQARRHGRQVSAIMLAEAALATLPDAFARRYVHASAGFAGFAKNAFNPHDLELFSSLMKERLGKLWNEWGSEQVASNYMLANSPSAVVLPFSRYACFEPHLPPGERSFLHYIGTYRFDHGVYQRKAQDFLMNYGRLLAGQPQRDIAVSLR